MKKSILTLILLVATTTIYSQMVVTDTGATAVAVENKANTAATLVKTKAMLEEITVMREKYDKMMDNVEVVKDIISSGQQIQNILSGISKLNTNYGAAVTYVTEESLIHPLEKAKYIGAFTEIIEKSLDQLDTAYNTTTNENYSMTDAERLNQLNGILNAVNKQNSLMIYFLNKIKRAVAEVSKKQRENDFIEKQTKSLKNN